MDGWIDWLVSWLTNRLNGWWKDEWIGCVIGWLVEGWINRLIECLTYSCVDRRIYYLLGNIDGGVDLRVID